MKKYLLIMIMALVPSLLMAQAAGGNIKRPSNSKKPHNKSSVETPQRPTYVLTSISDFQNGYACVEINKKWGAIDKTGRIVIPCKYDFLRPFSEGLAAVEINGKYGYIDTKNNIVVPCIYDFAIEIITDFQYNNRQWYLCDLPTGMSRIGGGD